MRKYVNYIIILVISFIFILSPESTAMVTSPKYEINSYNVKINVNENNTFDVEETISVNFLEEQFGGIAITIGNKNGFIDENGKKLSKHARVTNVEANVEYSKVENIDKTILSLGNSSEKVSGNQIYVIQYTYEFGEDPFKNKDEFYFNIFGNNIGTYVDNASFEIAMPKEFDEKCLNISSNLTGIDNIVYEVKDKKIIRGYYSGNIDFDEVVSVKIELPEGYFVVDNIKEIIVTICSIGISVLGVLICYLLWRKYGDDEPIVKVKSSNPPRDYNSAELGFFYKGEATPDDIMSLLIDLANKGYLKIKENYNTTLFVKERDFKIIKLKDYDGNNEIERIFLEGLFRENTEVSQSELNKRFYLTVKRIERRLESKKNIKMIFEDQGASKGKLVAIIGKIVALLTIVIPMITLHGANGFAISVVLWIFEVIAFTAFRIMLEYDLRKFSNILLTIVMFGMGVFFILTPILVVTRHFYFSLGYKVSYFVGLISFGIIVFIKHFMVKRTKFGTEILGEIEGFKEYLEELDKEGLDKEISKNKIYVYDILPYTYILGITDKWLKKFEENKIDKPFWFETEDEFEFDNLDKFIRDIMDSAIIMDSNYKKNN